MIEGKVVIAVMAMVIEMAPSLEEEEEKPRAMVMVDE